MVAAADGTAAVCRQRGISDVSLRESVKMSIEDTDQIELLESRQQIVCVQRAIDGISSHWKMREHDRGICRVQFLKIIVQPA